MGSGVIARRPVAPSPLRAGAWRAAAPSSLPAVREAVRLLLKAKKPLIVAGHGVLYAEAAPELDTEAVFDYGAYLEHVPEVIARLDELD